MKSLQLPLIVTVIILLTVAAMCSGSAVSLKTNEASVQTLLSSQTVQPGQTITITIIFNSNAADTLQITNVGIHFDWMTSGNFYGYDLFNAPANIPSGGGTYMFHNISVQVPVNITAGIHSYYISIDGTQGNSTTLFAKDSPTAYGIMPFDYAPPLFSWDSPTATITSIGGTQTTARTSPPSGTNSGSLQSGGQQNLLIYGVIGALVVVVTLLLIVVLVQNKRKPSKAEPGQGTGQPETPNP